MNATRNLTSCAHPFTSPSEKRPRWALPRARARRLTALLLLALALLAPGGWEPVTAQGKPAPKSYVQVSPDAAPLMVGETVQLRASVLSPVGFDLVHRKVAWTSSDPAIATVSDTGLVTAQAEGLVTIVARSGPALGTAAVTVNSPPPNERPVVTITAPEDGATFQEGETITFTATAADEDGDLSAAIQWHVAVATDAEPVYALLGTGASVSTSALAPGSYLVTATVQDSGELVGLAQIAISVNPPCSVVADFQPADGLYVPQLLQLDATHGWSYDTCGRELKYYWGCQNQGSNEASLATCPSFLNAANGDDNTNPTPVLDLPEFDIVVILLTVCVAGTDECSGDQGDGRATSKGMSKSHFYEGALVNLDP